MKKFDMTEKVIATIPIYRCSQEEYEKEIDMEKCKLKEYLTGLGCANNTLIHHIVELTLNENFKSWKYNEIIGFIEIFMSGDQLRGESYFIKHKKIRKNITNKSFSFNGKEFEFTIKNSKTNRDISKLLMLQLQDISISKKFGKRYFDLTQIKDIAPYINWKALLK